MGFSYYDDDSGYLPLTGGTISGTLSINQSLFVGSTISTNGNLDIGKEAPRIYFNRPTAANDFAGFIAQDNNTVKNQLLYQYSSDTWGTYHNSNFYGFVYDGYSGDIKINGNLEISAIYPNGQSFSSPAYIAPEYLSGNVGLRGLSSGPIVKWVSSSVQIRNSADSAYAPIDASAFTVNSEATNKSAILQLGSMLPEFEKLQFVEYLYQGMTEKMLGLEYAQTFAAGVTSILTNTPYSKGVNVSSLIALVGKALQEVVSELKTKGVLS